MSTPFLQNDLEAESTTDGLSTWYEVRRMADELELKIHLAGMNARDRWHALEPRLADLERRMRRAGERAGKAVAEELKAIWNELRGIRDDLGHGN
jgi:hypothetical protein